MIYQSYIYTLQTYRKSRTSEIQSDSLHIKFFYVFQKFLRILPCILFLTEGTVQIIDVTDYNSFYDPDDFVVKNLIDIIFVDILKIADMGLIALTDLWAFNKQSGK